MRRQHAHRVMTASTTTVRETPKEIYEYLDGQMHFTIDVCANEKNHKHPRYFSEDDNGLAQSWEGETFFCNPPYGKQIFGWVSKARDSCIHDGAMGALVLPARVDTDWWRIGVLQARVSRNHDAPAAGRLRDSRFDARNEVWWLRFERLVVGIHYWDERIAFDGLETGAPFPAAFVFMGAPRRRPVSPALLSSLPDRRDWRLLAEGWPR